MKSNTKSVFSIGPAASDNFFQPNFFILSNFLGAGGEENLLINLLWPNLLILYMKRNDMIILLKYYFFIVNFSSKL